MFPALSINNFTYRGQLEPLAVFNALCAGIKSPPGVCKRTLEHYKPDPVYDEDSLSVVSVVVIVGFVILLNCMVVYCYRRHTKREMAAEMQMQIESAVNQYAQLAHR